METITADPAAFINNRVELGFDDIGLALRGEPDWGDSEHELFLIRQALGEVPADRHPPNRNVALQLMVKEEGAVNLAEAAAKLQQKVGTWQREGGFVRRDFDSAGGFSTSVAQQVHGAALGGLQGWMFAHRQQAPDVSLNLVTGPYVYGTTAEESEAFAAAGAPHLKWEISSVKGSAPGLVRVTVKNEDASDWKGLLHSIESRYLAPLGSRTTTADVIYDCEKLTLPGGTTKEGAGEASNGEIAKAALSAGFVKVLGSKIPASGHMTHIGVRRIWLRARDPGEVAENIELKFEWRALGASRWTENQPVRINDGNEFAKVDLGEARPEIAALGEQRWEWRLMARARNGVGNIHLDCIFILSTEQFLALSAPPLILLPDSFSTKSPGSAKSVAGEGKDWTNPENVKAHDAAYAVAELQTVEPEAESDDLKTESHGFAIPAEATITGIVLEVERHVASSAYTVLDNFVNLNGGTIVDTSKYNQADKIHPWPESDAYAIYGSANFLWGQTWTPAQINAKGFGASVVALNYSGKKILTYINHIRITVYYTESIDVNGVCFASRSTELRTDGVYRQHPTDDVWARGVPDGFLPYAPPSGLEDRAARGIIVPSKGDHLTQPDTGLHKLSAVVRYFPGYHFTSEAT